MTEDKLHEAIRQIVSGKDFRDDITDFLVGICQVDTTPGPDIGLMARQEEQVFRIIRDRLRKLPFAEATLLQKKIDPGIRNHPAFSKLHFTKTAANPEGLSPEAVYRNRYNLLFLVNGEPSEKGHNPALNAHIDVVAPFFPPERHGETILGRGVIDDKGGVAAIYGALAVISRMSLEGTVPIRNRMTAMFVVEEETGGNGSLSLAIDPKLRDRYDSVLVMECAGNKVYPANRGAVWFWCSATLTDLMNTGNHGYKPSPLESMVWAILEMQEEGNRIREESDHPMFPHRPVQTCNGILGPFGEHPSRICGYVSFVIRGLADEAMHGEALGYLKKGLDTYTERYGDKTQFIDKVTGKPRVEKHFDSEYLPGEHALVVKVFGSTGHMGSLHEHDAAITKWAFMAREILLWKITRSLPLEIELEHFDSARQIVLEGGQGFLPTHPIGQVEERMRNAFASGIKDYLEKIGYPAGTVQSEVTFDKLHNNAFSCDPGAAAFRNAREAGLAMGMISAEEPVRGWDVSCDARLFAGENPGMPVITSGPGELHFAHSDQEQIHLPDLFRSIEFLALYLLKETGSA